MPARKANGGGNYKVTLVVQNTGWLPSYVSKRALERKVVRGFVAEIALAEPARRSSTASAAIDAGQLEGKAYKHTGVSFWPDLQRDRRSREGRVGRQGPRGR